MPRIVAASITTLILLLAFARVSVGLTVEKFTRPISMECKFLPADEVEGGRTCVRATDDELLTLGGHLTVAVRTTRGLVVSVINSGGEFGSRIQLKGSGTGAGKIVFSWDGDSSSSEVSGAGLQCLNLVEDQKQSLTIKKVSFQSECHSTYCPPLLVEARIYDASDPTGHTYSSAVIRRASVRSGKDLNIPFSAFRRAGPHGDARLSCVGAISVTFRLDGITDPHIEFGEIATTGSRIEQEGVASTTTSKNIAEDVDLSAPLINDQKRPDGRRQRYISIKAVFNAIFR